MGHSASLVKNWRGTKVSCLPPPRHIGVGGGLDIGWGYSQEQDSRDRLSPGHHLGPEPPSPNQALSPSLSALPPSTSSLASSPSLRSLTRLSPLAATELHF